VTKSSYDPRGAVVGYVEARIQDADALIEALGKLKADCQRNDWFLTGWKSARGTGLNAGALKESLSREFQRVETAALKLPGKCVDLADRLGKIESVVLREIVTDDEVGVDNDMVKELESVIGELAHEAGSRRRRMQAFHVVSLLVFAMGAAIGLLLGAAVTLIGQLLI
jgi:hypothetical protein